MPLGDVLLLMALGAEGNKRYGRFGTAVLESFGVSPMTLPQTYYVPLAAAVASAVALLDLPYGYYILLRVFFCGACVYYFSQPTKPLPDGHRAAIIALATLHNPVIPVHLGEKSLWTAVDFGTAAYFWWLSTQIRFTPPRRRNVDDPPTHFPLGGL